MPGVEHTGPFPAHCELVVDGWRVPFVQTHEMDGGRIMFLLDSRMAFDFPVAVADDVARFVANALAIMAGLGAHPSDEYDDDAMVEHLRQAQVHRALLPRRVHEIVAARSEEASPDPED